MSTEQISGRRLLVITMRYSVLLTQERHAWVIGRDRDEAAYKEALFNDARLDLHHELFRDVTLTSLAAQITPQLAQEVRLYVITSTELPNRHRKCLQDVLSNYPWARVKEVPPSAQSAPHGECIAEFLREAGVGTAGAYAHVRLDDDDALAVNFMNRIRSYTTSDNVGRVISLARGYAAHYEAAKGSFASILDFRFAMAAQGLSYIGAYADGVPSGAIANVYGLGNHTRVDTKVPVILDSRSPAFLRVYHAASDLNSEAIKLPKGKTVEPDKVLRAFPALKARYLSALIT